jgi:hypothetical protein
MGSTSTETAISAFPAIYLPQNNPSIKMINQIMSNWKNKHFSEILNHFQYIPGSQQIFTGTINHFRVDKGFGFIDV